MTNFRAVYYRDADGTEPVNDFAHVIDAPNATAIDQMSRALKAASGDRDIGDAAAEAVDGCARQRNLSLADRIAKAH